MESQHKEDLQSSNNLKSKRKTEPSSQINSLSNCVFALAVLVLAGSCAGKKTDTGNSKNETVLYQPDITQNYESETGSDEESNIVSDPKESSDSADFNEQQKRGLKLFAESELYLKEIIQSLKNPNVINKIGNLKDRIDSAIIKEIGPKDKNQKLFYNLLTKLNAAIEAKCKGDADCEDNKRESPEHKKVMEDYWEAMNYDVKNGASEEIKINENFSLIVHLLSSSSHSMESYHNGYNLTLQIKNNKTGQLMPKIIYMRQSSLFGSTIRVQFDLEEKQGELLIDGETSYGTHHVMIDLKDAPKTLQAFNKSVENSFKGK